MQEPLKHDAAAPIATNLGKVTSPPTHVPNGQHPTNVWKPVVVRVVLSGLALLGLAGVGAASMLAGLDGARAHASQPAAAQTSANPAPASPAAPAGAASSAPTTASDSTPAPALPACAGRTQDGKVILNLATVADLRTLSGIGQKRADAILALRDKLKRFKRIQELRRVRGIGAKTLQRLAPMLLIDPPAGTCAKPATENK